jgi:hypothetical protein
MVGNDRCSMVMLSRSRAVAAPFGALIGQGWPSIDLAAAPVQNASEW